MLRITLTAAALAALLIPGTAFAKIPLVNGNCPGGIDVHADEGGPIYLNGKEAKLKVFNQNYYEAKGAGITLSLAIQPDGTPLLSYTGPKGANGICQVTDDGSSAMPPAPAPAEEAAPAASGPAISRGNMPAYCRGEASSFFGVKPVYLKTGKIVKAADGSLSISGTADKGSEGIKSFMCRFDKGRHFIDVMALTSDGE